ncbi:MAG: 30S ribosomal protein S17 [Rhodospirillales bacterium]|nr:30S ribosomal protein S17 [Alphaproteobacteria bacterium]MCB9986479.1 30S ribosomal protein S17 [Rhodospirillales bacterium]USO06976.1 MAG: 30S ribosomal protein S17 [Rhodospirillales bacterium]
MPRRVLQGTVVSDKMDKTVTVLVERRVMHPKYKKYVKRSAKYAAHDEANVCQQGDTVSIEECRPISRNKSWRVIEGRDRFGKSRAVVEFNPATHVPAAKTAEAKAAPKKAAAKAEAKPATAKKSAAKKPAKAEK